MNRVIIYYKTAAGKCPVQDFIDFLNPKVQQKILWTLKLLKEIDRLKKPYFEKLVNTDDIWECRIKFASDIFRIFFFFDNNSVVILTHGFIKKTNKTPPEQIKRAENLKQDYFLRKK